jgi:ATP-binding cassette, subfamily C, bacterial
VTPANNRNSFILIWEIAREYPVRSALTLFSLLAASLMEGVGLALLLPLLSITGDQPSTGSSMEMVIAAAFDWLGLVPTLVTVLLLLVAAMAAKSVLMFSALIQADFTVAQIATDLRIKLIEGLMTARWGYYVSRPTGTLSNAIIMEAERASYFYKGSFKLLAALIQVGGYGIIALLVSWQVAFAAAGGSVILLLVFMPLIKIARSGGQEQTNSFEALSARIVDGLRGIKALRAMGRADRLAPILKTEANRLNAAIRKTMVSFEASEAFREPIVVLFMITGIYFAVAKFDITMEMVLMMAFLFHRTISQVSGAQKGYQGIVNSAPFYEAISTRLREVNDAREQAAGKPAPALANNIEIRNVHLNLGETVILRGANMTIEADRITTMRGTSGAGKTTLTDVILGFHIPDSGEILIDGIPLADIDKLLWRRQIGYVPQESLLFHDTIKMNISLDDPQISDADIWDAIKAAGIHEFVEQLPDGLATIVGEHGSRLSGGQRQRIAIARALVQKPRLLILDEPTTALDPETEAAICNTLKYLAKNTTILAVSHQQALADIADVVYVINQGEATPVQPSFDQKEAPERTSKGGSA